MEIAKQIRTFKQKINYKIILILLLNVVFIFAFLVAYLCNPMNTAVTHALIRDHLFLSHKCMFYLPEGVNFLYRKQNKLDYLVFPLFKDSLQENFVYVSDYRSLKKEDFHDPVMLNPDDFVVSKEFDSVFFMDSTFQWCFKKEYTEKCFYASKNSVNMKYFASRLDSINAYLKCIVGAKK